MISFKGSPNNRFVFNVIAKLDKSFPAAIRKGLQTSGVQIAGKAGRANDGFIKQEMNKPKHGRTYLVSVGRGGRKLQRLRQHVASRAGESPAVITGKLRDSVYFRVEGSNHLRIGANTPYARILELGGKTGRNHASYIARRNYLKRPILNSRRDIIRNLQNAINNNIK